MVMRAAWGPLFSAGAKAGETFATIFARGAAMGLQTFRRSVMLGDFRIARGVPVTRSMFGALPINETIPRAWLGPAHETQAREFRYMLVGQGWLTATGETASRVVSIVSDTALTKRQVLESAQAQWGTLTPEEQVAGTYVVFESYSIFAGRARD
jgi:hypothetical protein